MISSTCVKSSGVRTNVIRRHLIDRIYKISDQKKKILEVSDNTFIYFNNPIWVSIYNVNRFLEGNFYIKDEHIPIHWTFIDGIVLLKAYEALNSNSVYVLKQKDNLFYKTRVRDVVK